VDKPEGRDLDSRGAGTDLGGSSAWLGGPAGDRLVAPDPAAGASGPSNPTRAAGIQKKLTVAVEEETAKHPDKVIEVFASDEHRIGLKPIVRRIWAPVGDRPRASGDHRFEWLYVTAFVQPSSGEVFWYIANGVSKPFFEKLLATFAQEAGASRERIIILVLDNAGWHTRPGLHVPDGIRLVYLPPHSPELQPAECLWPVLDEPLANKHIATLQDLDRIIADRCITFVAVVSRGWWELVKAA
jgi:hypothetical protein